MSTNSTLIRNPEIFSNKFTTLEQGYPFQLIDGNFCPNNRNSRTTPYQTYSAYGSLAENANLLLTQPTDICEEPEIIEGCLCKCCEDICGLSLIHI